MSWYCIEEVDLNGVNGVVQTQVRSRDVVVSNSIVIDQDIGICFNVKSGPHLTKTDAEISKSEMQNNSKVRIVDSEFLEKVNVIESDFKVTF